MDILNEKIEGLVKKAEKSGMPYGILKKVYDRGMAAWRTGHRPGTTPQQWAFARVNSFVTKSSGTWGGADKDLAKQVRGEDVEVPKTKSAKELIGQVKEGIKPYVSMMKKNVNGRRKLHYRVLDKDEKEIFVTLDKKKADDFLKKNMSKLKSGTIKPIEEKLPKDADAGDYVKDFRKSKAPQFKGKSDKKIQKMAIAAYLDSKEEKDLDESTSEYKKSLEKIAKDRAIKALSRKDRETLMKISKMLDKERNEEKDLDERLKFKYALVDTSKDNEVVSMSSDEKDLKMSVHHRNRGFLKIVKLKKPTTNDSMIGYPLKEEVDIQESGHTDVPSMKTQVQIAMDALQKMNTELGKLSDEDELPTWWTNKVATAVNKLDGMADYIDAKHDQGQKMNEDNITEEKVFVVRFEKEGMRFAVPFSDMKRAKDGEKILKKSAGVSNVSITKDILKPGVSMSKFRTRQEGKIFPESKMGAFVLEMQIDANEMSERDFIKKYQGEMGMSAQELKRMYKEFNEEVDLDEDIKGYKPHVGPRDTLSYHLPKQKKSMKAFFDLVSKHPKVKNVKQETLRGRGGTVSKIDYDTDKNTQAALMRELDKLEKKFGEYAGQTNVVEEVNLQEGMSADTAKAILKMRAKDKFEIFRGDYVPMIYLSNLDRKALKDAGHKMTHDIPKPTMGTTVTGILNVANGSSKSTERAGMYDTETDDMKGKNPAVINMKKFVRGDFQKVGYPKTVGDLVKMTGLRLNSNDPMSNEEVHPMVKAAALATTVWAERRHVDPADIDVKATAADRKAADKNIIIQLRRAQDMEKQTGRADQSGIEFLDKKKQKVDPKIINKALDMFDKMKPNDKQKMQQAIGKSYRDLLKTVQRGRV